jgi:hypothetical protein
LAAPCVARAEDAPTEDAPTIEYDPDTQEYMAKPPVEPGRAKAVALGTVLGAVGGIAIGGAALIFYWNPDADQNFDTVLLITTLVGAVGGMTIGLTIPVQYAREDAPAHLDLNKHATMQWNVPVVNVIAEQTPTGTQTLWHGNLFKLTF